MAPASGPARFGQFEAEVPSLDAGRYHLFADVVDKYGYPRTAAGEIDLPAPRGVQATE